MVFDQIKLYRAEQVAAEPTLHVYDKMNTTCSGIYDSKCVSDLISKSSE